MYKICCAMFFTIIIISFSRLNAQEKEEYKYAFQFQIGPNFTLTDFQGSVLSGKYNFDKCNTLRLGLSIQNSNGESNELRNDPNSTINSLNNNNSYSNFTINFQYLRNNYWNDFNFYFGGGPSISYNFNENKTQADSTSQSSSRKTNGFGITILTGIEWFFNERMSLSAEYGLNFRYERRIENYSANNPTYLTSERKTKNFLIYPNGVLFGISVYF